LKKTVYLGLGSNQGDRRAYLEAAIARLGELGRVLALSSFYETEPVELTKQEWFLNCALALETELLPRQLLKCILDIEHALGRKRRVPKGPRTLDIDILLFGRARVELPGLKIPHPALHQRRFVLAPLAEIAPEARHPGLGRSVRELLEALPAGDAQVRRLS
jgi:2-amino-4-hydroxy-6-hydroxymethyldihydropteridine diphosphokinase